VSPRSPKAGDAPDATASNGEPERKRAQGRPADDSVAIELEVSRQRAIGWTAFGLIVGALLMWKLGTVGVWVGVVLIVIGGFRAWELVQSFVYPPGTITVTTSEVTLPRGLCLPHPVRVAPGDVTAVYFLRRSVPWNRSAPVLVVEIGRHAMAFPRDWFASEADQRHVVHALLRGAGTDGDAKTHPALAQMQRVVWIELAIGAGLALAGLAGALLGNMRGSTAYVYFLAPLCAGAIVFWRAFGRR
jgi:hypothetical protein